MTLGIITDGFGRPGDEIAAFSTNGILAGCGLINGSFCAVTIWADDELTNVKDGLMPGEIFVLKIWDNTTGEEQIAEVDEWIEGDGCYSHDAISIAGKLKLHQSSVPVLFGNVPSPFRDYTDISFYIPEETDVEITVYNALGMNIGLVYSGRTSPGYHSERFYTRNNTSGLCFIRLTCPGFTEVRASGIIR